MYTAIKMPPTAMTDSNILTDYDKSNQLGHFSIDLRYRLLDVLGILDQKKIIFLG